MTDDNFSNNTYGASTSYVYNNRLHIANIKTTFFKGFDFRYFYWLSAYNGVALPPSKPGVTYAMEVEIDTGAGTQSVRTQFKIGEPFLSAYISYPDSRATKITFYIETSKVEDTDITRWVIGEVLNLKPHKFLNIAYALEDSLKPVQISQGAVYSEKMPDKVATLTEPGKMKVSGLNNPMYFPNINTYMVGDGEILAMSTNSMNVADFNYGQYPLYVFTTQGIWTLNVGTGEVVYSALSSPTSMEAPVSRIIGATPFGVVFVSKKGLMLINGNAVEFISPQLEELRETLNIEPATSTVKETTINHSSGVILDYAQQSFSEYLSRTDAILYNPYETELIICDRESEFNYVLNIQSRSFYQSTEKIGIAVKNTFPDLFVSDGKKIKDYAAQEVNKAHVSFITRPLTFGSEDIKKLDRMILRGIFHNMDNPVTDKKSLVRISHSIDGVNFPVTRGKLLAPANYKDIDMGLMSRSKFRYFMISFGAGIAHGSKITFLESILGPEYDNEKMR